MNIFQRIGLWPTDAVREVIDGGDASEPRPLFIAPPARSGGIGWSSADRALSLSTVYRGIQIHTTAAIQLGVDVFRDDKRVDPTPALVRRPDVDTTREAFVEYTIACLWLTGDAFWRLMRDPDGGIWSIRPLNPGEVHVAENAVTRRPEYTYRGELIAARDIRHLKMLRVPGHLRGLGPIQAARLEVEGAIDARDYGASWFTESGMPSGILSTDQELTPDQAKQYKTIWNENEDGYTTRVLGAGLNYEPLLLKPADVQFLESQQFNTTGIARLLGVPASLMLAAVEGKSNTYSNLIDEWRAYLQFSAMKALREVETAWSDILPGKQTVRFNLDAFLRLDTLKRYQAHEIGLRAGFLRVNEVRALEGLPAVDGGDALTAPTTAAATPQETADVDAAV